MYDVLLAAGSVPPDGRLSALPHAFGEQRVRLGAALVGAEEISLVVVDRINALRGHELADLDHLRAFFLHLLQLLGREGDVLILRELVTLDHVGPLHDHAFLGAKVLLFQA